MKLFDVFKRKNIKEAAGFSTEVANPKPFEIADPSSCNCAEKLGIVAPSTPSIRIPRDAKPEEVREQIQSTPSSTEAKKDFHKTVVNKWLDLMNEPDASKRTENVNTLATLQRTTPTADANHEFQNHLLSHLYGAGMSHRDLGISDNELGSQFKESQGLMQQSQTSAANQPHYNVNNCGVCNQYLSAIKSHVAKYKEHLDNASMMSTSTKPEDAGKSEDELLANIHDDFMSGNKTRSSQSSAVAAAHGILGNWQKHLGNAHKYDFTSFYDPYTPVVTGDDSKKFLTTLFKKNVQRLAPGWKMRKRQETPTETLPSTLPGGPKKKIVETPGSTIKGFPTTYEFSSEFEAVPRGGYFTREQRGQQEYNPEEDTRNKTRRFNAKKENTMTTFNSGGSQKLTTIQDVKERMEALANKNKKVCEKCGLHCADADECKKNRDNKKRNDAADSAYWND